MVDILNKLKTKHYVSLVGGSDISKITEQVGKECSPDNIYYFNSCLVFGFCL